MCYSALCYADFQRFKREFGARIDIHEFARLFGYRKIERRIKIPRAIERNFLDPQSDEERAVLSLIDEFKASELSSWETELFSQRRRLADAERTLAAKPTKKAENDKRIAGNKIEQLLTWITNTKLSESRDTDSRIYPGHYAAVMVWEEGARVIKPMRYQCRIHGWTQEIERRYPGTYNARRDSLEKSWSEHFGVKHGLIVASAFYENVSRHSLEGRELASDEREENVILEFRPRPAHDMLVACVWSDWSGPDQPPLLSFAAITDEPPAEIAAAGHDRCIVPIRPENINAWLQPGGNLASMYEILDDRDRPYYDHRVAA